MRTISTRNFYILVSFLLTTLISAGQTTYMVTSGSDSGPDTLRQAVLDANANPGPDIIRINLFVAPTLTSGTINITDPVTINATGANINAVNNFNIAGDRENIFTITDAGTVNISTVNFRNGAAANGGAIFSDNTNLNISSSTFQNNIANGPTGSGGAIFTQGTGALSITAGSFIGNTANRAGGAIEVQSSGNLTVSGFTVLRNNSAVGPPGNGGAIHITGAANSTITGRFLTNNAANEGGALWNGTGTMTLTGCDIDGNIASGALAANGGGGIFNNG